MKTSDFLGNVGKQGAMMTVRMAVRQGAARTLSAMAASLIALAASDPALAQAWPARTVTAIVPFTAGSGADVIARIALNQVSKQVGSPIIVENRGGAGGTLGANIVAKAAPDGYTILASGSLGTTHGLYPTLPYATLQDFTPVIPLGLQPLVLVAAPSKGFNTLGDLITAAKATPGVLNFGSGGIGSATHFAAERLRISAGLEVQHVPFRGPNEALSEVLAGRLDFFFLPLAAALPLIKDGKLIALAVSASKRAAGLPLVPTTTEAGLVDSVYEFWVGLFLPARTSRDIVVKLYNETSIALQTPSVQERLSELGIEPMPMSLDQFDKFFRDDVAASVKLVKAANIRVQ